jgi:hypothetical protein
MREKLDYTKNAEITSERKNVQNQRCESKTQNTNK